MLGYYNGPFYLTCTQKKYPDSYGKDFKPALKIDSQFNNCTTPKKGKVK